MSLTGKIMNLFANKEMTIPIFPRTKVKAISDDNGVGLNVILNELATKEELNNLDASDVGAAAASHTHSNYASSSHNHSASNITSGTLAVARGGTGVTTNAAIGLKAYPPGAIYISTNDTSPASLFGGKWTKISGRFLLGCSSSYGQNTTGGKATHTLTVNEMPSHKHKYESGYFGGLLYMRDGSTNNTEHEINDDFSSETVYTTSVGGGAAHNNMPPYLAVNMWKRLNDDGTSPDTYDEIAEEVVEEVTP